MENNSIQQRIIKSVTSVIPSSLRTSWWIIRLTVVISFAVELLRYFGVVAWISKGLSPAFELVGLPGEAALSYITGYFVNVYSAIAVMASLHLDARSLTILAVMVLCSHNMIVETAVQKKTGSSFWRIIIMRTFSAIALGFILNLIMPASLGATTIAGEEITQTFSFLETLQIWALKTGWLSIKILIIIIGLSVLQRLLSEFGVIRWLSKLLRPFLHLFGLPGKTSFLWIVANFLGLAYGAAVMIEESEQGKISPHDADLLNHHISVSHSNVEDILLLYAAGGLFWWMLLPRLAWAALLVWERRLEWWIRAQRKGKTSSPAHPISG